jgi:predicted PurR-regulated permease PerM
VVVAVSLQPGVAWLRRHGAPPALAALAGALAVPVGLVALGVLFAYTVVAQASGWKQVVDAAGEYLDGALGADPVRTILQSGQWRSALIGVGSLLTNTVVVIAQLAVGLLAGAYLLFYAFLDGHRLVAAVESRVPLPAALVRSLRGDATLQLRRYVLGTTIVAGLDAVVITAGAAILGLPFLLTIAVITFVAAFVPYLGAWLSAAFVVLIALGTGGLSTGLWMLAIVLLTQNVLEGVLRPFVFGRALGLHPVVVLAATVAGAALGGLAGVFLAPPIAAIAVSWYSAVRAHRAHRAPDG